MTDDLLSLAGEAIAQARKLGADAAHAVGLIAPLREPHTPVIAALLQEARRMAGD